MDLFRPCLTNPACIHGPQTIFGQRLEPDKTIISAWQPHQRAPPQHPTTRHRMTLRCARPNIPAAPGEAMSARYERTREEARARGMTCHFQPCHASRNRRAAEAIRVTCKCWLIRLKAMCLPSLVLTRWKEQTCVQACEHDIADAGYRFPVVHLLG